MPNERSRRRAARRVDFFPRPRVAPVLLLGLIAVAVIGQTPSTDAPVRWTVRDASGWMAEYDAVRQQRSALIALASPVAAARGDRLAAAPAAPVLQVSADVTPASKEAVPVVSAPIVVAEADLVPRDETKRVPLNVVDPDVTGAVPGARRPTTPAPEVQPSVNRSGKGDRLLAPQPLGRTTDRDLFVKPTLATVAPSQEGWPPMISLALMAPQPAKVLPHLALAAPDRVGPEGRMVVAMVRTGPGKIVTQSAIAALGEHGRSKIAGRPLLPPVPEAQVAAAPRTQVWAQPAVPELGYARRAADSVLARFRAVLGDEGDPAPETKAD